MSDLLKVLRGYGGLSKWSKYQIVTRHALADETELLTRLGGTPEKCTSCDLYWLFRDNLFFLSIWYPDQENHKGVTPKVLYNWDEESTDIGAFNVITHAQPLKTTDVEASLDRLAIWVEEEYPVFEKPLPGLENSVVIIDRDICLTKN